MRVGENLWVKPIQFCQQHSCARESKAAKG
jgi:hypothetical protein